MAKQPPKISFDSGGPPDAMFTRSQVHTFGGLADRFGVAPSAIQDLATRGDNLDPVMAVLRQIAQNPPVANPALTYSDYGRVVDPASGAVFHRGDPHPPANYYTSGQADLDQIPQPHLSMDNFMAGVQRQAADTYNSLYGGTVGQVPGQWQDLIASYIRHVQKAFPNAGPNPNDPYFETGPASVDLNRNPMTLLIKMLAGNTGDITPRPGAYNLPTTGG